MPYKIIRGSFRFHRIKDQWMTVYEEQREVLREASRLLYLIPDILGTKPTLSAWD